MLRVLTRGGRIAIAVWDSLEADPAYAAVVDVLDRTAGRDAADALRAPFVLGDREALGALFHDSGAGPWRSPLAARGRHSPRYG